MSQEKLRQEDKARDYDKEPIIIEDYNYIFEILCLTFGFILVLYAYFINPLDNTNEISRNYFFMNSIGAVLIPTVIFYFQMRKSKRKIILKNNEILFMEGNELLESININNIRLIQRTFNDYYLKSQDVEGFGAIFTFLIVPIYFPLLIINKFLFHIFKNGLNNYRLFDAIIIFDNDDKFINILPTTKNERTKIINYFSEKNNINIEQSKLFYKLDYGYK